MHIQKRREMEREAEIKAADAAAKAAENWMGKFGDVVSADNIGKTLARAFEGAAGFMGALKSLASQVAGVFMSHMGGLLSTGLKTVLPSVFGAVATSVVPAAAAAGASAGVATGTAAATATGTSLLGGLSAVAAAIPGWGWAAAGVAAAFFFWFLTQMYARFSSRQVGQRRGKTLRMCSCPVRSGAVVCRSIDGRLRGPSSWWGACSAAAGSDASC